jgi:hypothetical protein
VIWGMQDGVPGTMVPGKTPEEFVMASGGVGTATSA